MSITINLNNVQPLDELLTALSLLAFTGNENLYLRVNSTATAFEFAAVSSGGGTWGSITGTLSDQTDLQTALNGKVNENAAITGATKTKITYDAKGLVTAGADADIADITGLQAALDDKAALAGAAFTGAVSVATSGSGTTLNLTNSGSGTTLNIANSGSGSFLVIDTNKMVVNSSGVTTISELNLTTKLADAYISSAATWNAKENALGFTPENVANKSTITTLGTSDSLYPTQNAVKSYVDTELGTKQDTLISATNIKSINGNTLLGSGDLVISAAATWGSITGTLSNQTDLQAALDLKVDENAAITGATKTKITYDAKGLVTAGADATTADINDSSNRRYVTDAQQTILTDTSGTNTGDQNLFSTIAVSGQSNVVADATTDTLTLVAGSNITITTDAATDAITIASVVLQGINTQTASYTLVLADDSKLVRMNVASANNLTIPPNSSVAFAVGTVLYVEQMGAGTTTIVAGSGVTINPTAKKTPYQYGVIALIQVATDVWNVIGGTV